MKDSNKEEIAWKLVQNDLSAMKEEIRQIKLGSGSTVCSEAITAVASRIVLNVVCEMCDGWFKETAHNNLLQSVP